MSRDCCVALPRGAMGLSAVCQFGISWSYSLTIFIGLASDPMYQLDVMDSFKCLNKEMYAEYN